jgi:DNA-binding transcriptional regulator YdaS (Cro superfamily)
VKTVLVVKRRKSGRTLDKPTPESLAAMARIRAERGLLRRIADELKVSLPAVSQWQQVPLDRVIAVEQVTGILREQLRADFHLPRADTATNGLPVFTYQARDAQEYLEVLFRDPRPWWHEAKPRKKARFQNVKLTNSLHVKQRLEA